MNENPISLRKTSLALILIFLFVLSVSFAPSTLADEPFNAGLKVYDDYWGSSQIDPSITVDENGTAYIVWFDADNKDVLFSKTSDGGATFTQPVKVSDVAGIFSPSIAVDETGNIYITWSTATTLYFAKSVDNGYSFTSSRILNDTLYYQPFFPSIVVVAQGNIYITWERGSLDLSHIYFVKSTNGGKSFSEPIRVSEDSSAVRMRPSIATDNYGNIFIVWVGGGNIGANIHFAKSTNGGVSFEPNVNVSTAGGEVTQVDRAITVSSNGCIFAVWANGNIYINKSVDGGKSFLPGIKINDENTTGVTPSVGVDRNGNVHVAWLGSKDSYDSIYYDTSLNGGESFGTDIKVNDVSALITHRSTPSIGVDKDGEIYVVWQAQREDLDSGIDYVYFSTTNSPIYPVTLNSPTEITPNSMNLSWSQNTNSDFDRYEVHMSTDTDFTIDQSTLIASITEEATTFYNTTSLAENVLYHFKVRLFDLGRLYTDSNEVSGTTLDEIPTAIILNDPIDITNSSMNLSWSQNTNSDFARYEVHTSTDANFTIDQSTLIVNITNQTTTFYNVTDFNEDETYYFKIRIYDIGGSYSDSNEVHAQTLEDDEYASTGGGFSAMFDGSFWIIFLIIVVIISVAVAIVKRKCIVRLYRNRKGARTHEREDKKS